MRVDKEKTKQMLRGRVSYITFVPLPRGPLIFFILFLLQRSKSAKS